MQVRLEAFTRGMFAGTQKVAFQVRIFLMAAAGVAVARPAVAEVMDKELSRSDIAHSLLPVLVTAVGAAALHRWLLLPLFAFGPVRQLGFAWTEWHDPFVGPAITHEDGAAYGVFADGAMTIAVVAHLVLWFLSSRARHRSRSALQDVLFTTALFLAVFFQAWLGFHLSWRSFLSVPMIIAGVAVFLAARRFRREQLVPRLG